MTKRDFLTLGVGLCGGAVGLAVFAYFAAAGLLAGYSYWIDELFSVTGSKESLGHLFSLIFDDVHPPLYQLGLWGWISVFGESEFATRGLSVLAVSLAILSLLMLRRDVSRETLALVFLFFTVNPFLHFYAQETRSYGLVLLFSTLSMIAAIRRDPVMIFVACVLLGMTHFFGSLLALLVLAQFLWFSRSWSSFLLVTVAAALILAWPVALFLFGSDMSEKMGGNFWIGTGPLLSIHHGVRVAVPPLLEYGDKVFRKIGLSKDLIVIATPAVLLAGAWLVASLSRRTGQVSDDAVAAAEFTHFKTVFGLLLATLAAVAILSLHTPVSTPRNYIIMVPFGAFTAAYLCRRLMAGPMVIQALTVALCLFYVVVSLQAASHRLGRKMFPTQEWREMAVLGAAIAEEKDLPLYHFGDRRWRSLAYQHYLPDGVRSTGIGWDDPALTSPFVLMYGHASCQERDGLLARLEQTGTGYELVEMRQSSNCETGSRDNGIVVVE